MKKVLPFLLCAALLAGCSNSTANTETEPETKEETTEETGEEVQTVGVYTIYNATGEGVTELYLYPTGAADKGENYAAGGHGFGDAHAKILEYDAAAHRNSSDHTYPCCRCSDRFHTDLFRIFHSKLHDLQHDR